MKCEMITRVLLDVGGMQTGEEYCRKEAVMCDVGLRMCFTCARSRDLEGDILSASGTRRFREIERVVATLPS